MSKILITLFLMGQFAMTPERQAAMDKAGVDIRAQQAKIVAMQQQQTQLAGFIVTAQVQKQKKITDAMVHLGLDATWSWDDTTNTFIQAKK